MPEIDTGPGNPRRYRRDSTSQVFMYAEERDQMLMAARDGHAPSEANSKLLTTRQEQFAQGVAQGMSFAQAYKDAYSVNTENGDTHLYTEAALLSKLPHVTNRIAQLIATSEQEQRVTQATRAARVTRVLEGMMQHGKTDSARIRAAELLGKSVGLFADKKEESAREVEDLDDLEARLQKLLARETKPPSDTPET